MTAFLIVRAEVDPAAKDEFDTWYRDVTSAARRRRPTARQAPGAAGARWTKTCIFACYEFADLADVNG